MENAARGLDGRGGVDRIGNQENDCADDLERMGPGLETPRQILGNGNRVVGDDGKRAQPRRFKNPAQRVTQRETDGDPDLTEAGRVNRGRKAHQDPGAHIRGAGGEGADPGTHVAAAEEIFLFTGVFAAKEEDQADPDHKQKIDDEDDGFRPVCNLHDYNTPRTKMIVYSILYFAPAYPEIREEKHQLYRKAPHSGSFSPAPPEPADNRRNHGERKFAADRHDVCVSRGHFYGFTC